MVAGGRSVRTERETVQGALAQPAGPVHQENPVDQTRGEAVNGIPRKARKQMGRDCQIFAR